MPGVQERRRAGLFARLLVTTLMALGKAAASPAFEDAVPRKTVDQFGDALPDRATARCGTVRLRPLTVRGNRTYGGRTAVSSDRKVMLSESVREDGLDEWDLATGKALREIRVPTRFPAPIEFSEDGRFVLLRAKFPQGAGTDDQMISAPLGFAVFSYPGFEKRFALESGVTVARFSPNGRFLCAVDGKRKKVAVHAAADGRVEWSADFPDEWDGNDELTNGGVECAAVSADGTRAWVGGDDFGSVIQFRKGARTYPIRRVGRADGSPATYPRLALSRDGSVVALSDRRLVAAFDTASGRFLFERDHAPADLHLVALSSDGRRIAFVDGECPSQIEVYDIGTGLRRLSVSLPVQFVLGDGEISVDGKLLVAHTSHQVHLWDVETGRPLTANIGSDHVFRAWLSNDGRFVASEADDGVRLWDVVKGRHLHHLGMWHGAGFENDGDHFHTWSASRPLSVPREDVTIRRFSVVTGEYDPGRALPTDWPPEDWPKSRPIHEVLVDSAGPDAWYRSFGRVFALRLNANGPPSTYLPPPAPEGGPDLSLSRLAVSSGGAYAACLTDGGSVVTFPRDAQKKSSEWRPAKGKAIVARWVGNGPVLAAWCVDDDTPMRSELRFQDAVTGMEQTSLPLGNVQLDLERGKPYDATPFAVTPDGSYAATADGPRIDLWELKSGRKLRTLEGHRGSVNVLEFSKDGRRLVSGSSDCTLLIWEPFRDRLK